MPLAYTYSYRASECPAPQTPLAPLYKGADPPTPVSADALGSGGAASQSLIPKFNRNAVRLDLNTRYGGPGIWWGLDLEEGDGLTGRVTNGQCGLDGIAEVKQTAGYTSLALTDGQVCRIWLSRGSTVNQVSGNSASPLSPPDTATLWHYLGAFACAGGDIIALDRSGVIYANQGGILWRRTADDAEPDDTPPASVRLFTRTEGGLYLWDGTQHSRIDSDEAGAALTALESVMEQRWLNTERTLRRLLFNLVTTFSGVEMQLLAGLETDFALAAAEAE